MSNDRRQHKRRRKRGQNKQPQPTGGAKRRRESGGTNAADVGEGSSPPTPKCWTAYIPSIMLDDRYDDRHELAGKLLRLSYAESALFLYLMCNYDDEDGRIRGTPERWSRPTEHHRDVKTVRKALSGLVDAGLVERDADGGVYVWSEAYLLLKARCRPHAPSPWRVVRYTAGVIHSGKWATLTDSARLQYVLGRKLCPSEIHGADDATKRVSGRLFAHLMGACLDTVYKNAKRLESLGLVKLKRSLFHVTEWLCPFEVLWKLGDRMINLSHRLADVFKGEERWRERAVVWHHRSVGRSFSQRLAAIARALARLKPAPS